jgi:phage shock protein E
VNPVSAAALVAVAFVCAQALAAPPPRTNDNPQIDAPAFVRHALQATELREPRRVSEEEFIRMAREPGTVVLDARSERMFKLRHVKGAVNLTFPDFTQATLARVIPTRQTRVLIYCNNNFLGAPESLAMKAPPASLNLSTFVALHTYCYRNVYELGPLIDLKRSKIAFEGDEVRR